jgi:hypothetical protein
MLWLEARALVRTLNAEMVRRVSVDLDDLEDGV